MLPTWTCDQIGAPPRESRALPKVKVSFAAGILLDNWGPEDRTFTKVAQAFVYFDRLSTNRREHILRTAFKALPADFSCADDTVRPKVRRTRSLRAGGSLRASL